MNRGVAKLDEYEGWQRREWRIQKIGWRIWMSVLCAGWLGLIGHGLLSRRSHFSTDRTLSIAWERFEHLHAPTRLEVMVRPKPGQREVAVAISQKFWSSIEVHRIQPEPNHTVLIDDGVRLSFSVEPDVTEAKVLLYFEFETIGIVAGKIDFQDQSIGWRQFVYP